MNIAKRFSVPALYIAQKVGEVLTKRGLPTAIKSYDVVQTELGNIFLVMPLEMDGVEKLSAFLQPDLVAQIGATIRRPTFLHEGKTFAYVVLLSERNSLPDFVEFMTPQPGNLVLGLNSKGVEVSMPWEKYGHMLIGGMTGSGKSTVLRLIVAQAIAQEFDLLLADGDGMTFGGVRGTPNLLAPIAENPVEVMTVTQKALEIINHRNLVFSRNGNFEDWRDYVNATGDKVKPVLVIFDEFNSLVQANGGKRSDFARDITQIAWRGRKFGLIVILAGQTFEKDIVGPVRDQMLTRICFQVANSTTSQIIIGRPGAEKLNVAGRALTNHWGLIQTYYHRLTIDREKIGVRISPEEEEIIQKLLQPGFDGEASFKNFSLLGISQRPAERLRKGWINSGLAVYDKNNKNVLVLNQEHDIIKMLKGIDL